MAFAQLFREPLFETFFESGGIELLLDLLLQFAEILAAFSFARIELENMNAHAGSHRRADLPDLHLECGLLHRFEKLAAFEPAELAAFRRSRVLRTALGDFRE